MGILHPTDSIQLKKKVALRRNRDVARGRKVTPVTDVIHVLLLFCLVVDL